jgi:aspartate racemase
LAICSRGSPVWPVIRPPGETPRICGHWTRRTVRRYTCLKRQTEVKDEGLRKLGIIGGMSWVSTAMYYDRINRIVQKRAAPMASAPLLIESLDFAQLYALREERDWQRAASVLIDSAKRLEGAGAEGLIIGANSMHRLYDDVAASVNIPILHIAEFVGMAIKRSGHTSAALIGTRNVMTESFYRKRLVAHGIDLLPPNMEFVELLDKIIYDELMVGKVTREAERTLKTIITKKAKDGAQAIVLACTELDLVVDVDANVLPVFDSTRIHCEAAANWILEQEGVS